MWVLTLTSRLHSTEGGSLSRPKMCLFSPNACFLLGASGFALCVGRESPSGFGGRAHLPRVLPARRSVFPVVFLHRAGALRGRELQGRLGGVRSARGPARGHCRATTRGSPGFCREAPPRGVRPWRRPLPGGPRPRLRSRLAGHRDEEAGVRFQGSTFRAASGSVC